VNEDRVTKWIELLYRIEEMRIQKELDEEAMAEQKDRTLAAFRKSKAGESGKLRRHVFKTMRWAAVVIMVIGIPAAIYIVYQDRAPDYSLMLEEISDQQMDENTSLILSDGSAIAIESDQSVITYDRSGEKVKIEAEQTISLDHLKETEKKEVLYNRLVVPYGRQSTITLCDGTVIWLNAGSYLIYPREFSGKKREVYLAGEGYFQVKGDRDRPFVVTTDDLEIEVLGTVFNVNSYPETREVETVLVEGSVKVSKSDARNPLKGSRVIHPGQLVTYSRESEKFSTREVDVEFYISWKDGYFLCDKITLERLAQKLSRHYNVQIVVEDELLKRTTFSGKLDNKESVLEVLEIINASKSIDYHREGGAILIRRGDR